MKHDHEVPALSDRSAPKHKHILSAHDFPEADIQKLFEFADKAKTALNAGKGFNLMPGRTLATLFYDPSTRTRPSMEVAMAKLGGALISVENARNSTNDIRGESLEDVIRSVSAYVDAIALRHPEPGAAVRASKVASCPILNCSDGNNESPIQALQDLYTIQRLRPDAQTLMFVGDISNSPVVSSLAHFANVFDLHIFYTGTFRPSQLPPGRHTSISEANLGSYINQADVLYLLGNRPGGTSKFKLTLDYASALKETALILHPFPRGKELPVEIDADPRAGYFEQSRNGLFIRMAVLNYVLGR